MKARYGEIRAAQREHPIGAARLSAFSVMFQMMANPPMKTASREDQLRAIEENGVIGALSWGDVFFDIESNQMAAKLYGEAVGRIVERPRNRGVVDADAPVRLQAPDHRPGLLRDVQPRQRHAGRPAQGSDPRGDADGHRHRAGFYELDVIIYATGFDAMTGALSRIDIRGRDGVSLKDFWADEGPLCYLGLAVAGFPNLFIVQAPGSPAPASNFVAALEQHVEWIGDCITYLRANGYRTIEAQPDAQQDWIEHITSLVAPTVLVHPTCNSWYNGGNVPGKKRMYMGYTGGNSGISPAMRRGRRRRLHRVQARVADEDIASAPSASVGISPGVLPRAHAALRSSGDWNPLSPSGARQLGEVVLDELALSGMTLTAPPPRLERTWTRATRRPRSSRRWESNGRMPSPEPLAVKSIRRRRLGRLTYEKLSSSTTRRCRDSLAAAGLGGPATAVAHLCRTGRRRAGRGWCGCTAPVRASRSTCCSPGPGAFGTSSASTSPCPSSRDTVSRRDAWPPYPNMDPLTNVAGMMRVVSEVRALVRWLRPQSTAIAVSGVSMGSPVAALVSHLEQVDGVARVHTDPRPQRDDRAASRPMGPFGGRHHRAVGSDTVAAGDLRGRPHGRRTDARRRDGRLIVGAWHDRMAMREPAQTATPSDGAESCSGTREATSAISSREVCRHASEKFLGALSAEDGRRSSW